MPFPTVPDFAPLADPQAIVSGKSYRFTVLTDRLIRLEYDRSGRFEDRPSQVAWKRQFPVTPFTRKVTGPVVEIETASLRLRYRESFLGFTRFTLSITLKDTGVTWRYGDSPRRGGNLLGTTRTLDMYPRIKHRLGLGLLSRSGWALVDDSHSLVFNATGWLEPRRPRETDLYFFGYGEDGAGCLGDYTRLAGPVPMIPRFILGNWWSRYWAYTAGELTGLMDEFRQREYPLSVVIVDIDWHPTQSSRPMGGWTGYTWNRELFPDPPAFIHGLHERGLRTALNLHPAQGVRSFEEAYPDMARWMGLDPASGKTVKFDIANPRFAEGYFKYLHHPQEANGVDFWWMDWQQGSHTGLKGLDPLWWLNHLHFYDLGRDGRKRPFVFSRWGGLGNHRYPIGFSGDTFIGWPALAYQPYFTANAANVAYGWWSHDLGGHMFKDVTPELTLRWMQFGLFSPIFRIHSTKAGGADRRPWTKPERIASALREVMQARYAFIPYIYTMAWRAHRTGLSLVTPMVYGHMGEADAFRASDQYFFGTELVVAPFITPSDPQTGLATRPVWLPAGQWFTFYKGEALAGGWQSVSGGLEDIPVYARAGAIVPLGPRAPWGDTSNPAVMDLYVFPGADNRFELYEDDGETTAYQAGAYALTPLSLSRQEDGLHLVIGPVGGHAELAPSTRTWQIHLRGVGPTVIADRPSGYDSATHTLDLAPVDLAPHESLTVRFTLGE